MIVEFPGHTHLLFAHSLPKCTVLSVCFLNTLNGYRTWQSLFECFQNASKLFQKHPKSVWNHNENLWKANRKHSVIRHGKQIWGTFGEFKKSHQSCWFIICCCSHCLWRLCVWSLFWFIVLVSFLVLQSSHWGRERLYFCCVLNAMSLLLFFDSSLQCCRLVCSMWLWHFLVILTYFKISDILICHARKALLQWIPVFRR